MKSGTGGFRIFKTVERNRGSYAKLPPPIAYVIALTSVLPGSRIQADRTEDRSWQLYMHE